MSNERIRILLVDDHPVVLKGLAAILRPEPDMEVVGSAHNARDAVRQFREKQPDITIMDITLGPEVSGIDATAEIRRDFPEARIIVLTIHQGADAIYRALKAGAATYLLKDTLGDELVRTIREVFTGGGAISAEIGRKFVDRASRPSLTQREREVLQLVADGLRNKEIAVRLAISEQTVLTHVKNIFAKLGVSDRTMAVTAAFRHGIIDLAP